MVEFIAKRRFGTLQADGFFSDRQRDILALVGLFLATLHTALALRSFFREGSRLSFIRQKLAWRAKIDLEFISESISYFIYDNRIALTCFVVIETVSLLLAGLFERSGSMRLLFSLVLSALFLAFTVKFLITELVEDDDRLTTVILSSIFSFPLVCWLLLTFAHLSRPTSWLVRALVDQLAVLGAPGALIGIFGLLFDFKQIREDWLWRTKGYKESYVDDLAILHPDIEITPTLHNKMIQFLSDKKNDGWTPKMFEESFLQEHARLTQTSTRKMNKRRKQVTKSNAPGASR
jgi:hypothetical protein